MGPESTVNLEIIRDGKTKEIKITIGTMPEEMAEQKHGSKSETAWGITVQNLTPELIQRFGLEDNETGVIITELQPGSAAAEARLMAGRRDQGSQPAEDSERSRL